eukprot:scaffold4969_cov104-Amphora_coffeaeformis.AAC.2
MEYKTFPDMGRTTRIPPGYQQIPLRMVFDVKQTLKRKARLVARGDKTDPLKDSVYSGVASLRSLRIVTFLAELNGLHLTGGDIGNAYLEAYTKEKVCTIAGPKFGPLQDPDVWIRDGGDCYEYTVVYVDDIFTALKEPVIFYDAIQSEPWNYKLKNIEEPKYHLGGDFFRDSDGTFCYGAPTYVKRMSENYEQLFGEPPKEYHSPMERGDQPELDVTMELGTDDRPRNGSLIFAIPYVRSASLWMAQPGCSETTSRWSRVPLFPILHWENVGMLCLIIVS